MALAAEGRSAVSQNIAEKTGMFSIATIENYRGKWQEFGQFVKEDYGVKDLEKLTGDHVKEFLTYKTELGISYSHWSGYAAAFGKLETALKAYSNKFDRGNNYDFRCAIRELRPEARDELPRFTGTRNYDSPRGLIAAIDNQAHRLAATIQLESGLRLAGASIIKESQLRGYAQDSHSGKNIGLIDYIGKGGKPGTAHVSPEVYRALATHITSQGEFRVSADGYRQSLKEAAQLTGQHYSGSHGLRWNFAPTAVYRASDEWGQLRESPRPGVA